MIDRNMDGKYDCHANRGGYIFADYPPSKVYNGADCNTGHHMGSSLQCHWRKHVLHIMRSRLEHLIMHINTMIDYGESSGNGGCYMSSGVDGSGWGQYGS